jgi:hypothetical protein
LRISRGFTRNFGGHELALRAWNIMEMFAIDLCVLRDAIRVEGVSAR